MKTEQEKTITKLHKQLAKVIVTHGSNTGEHRYRCAVDEAILEVFCRKYNRKMIEKAGRKDIPMLDYRTDMQYRERCEGAFFTPATDKLEKNSKKHVRVIAGVVLNTPDTWGGYVRDRIVTLYFQQPTTGEKQ